MLQGGAGAVKSLRKEQLCFMVEACGFFFDREEQ